jgi:hypothetical protein
MDERSFAYRALAAECLELAGSATDLNRRSEYLALAHMWTELAEEAARRAPAFDRVGRAFNNAGKIAKAVEAAPPVQQQQQIQPKKRGS